MPKAVRPKLRRELVWKRFAVEGQDSYVFKNELTQDYLKLDPISGTLATHMDGRNTEEDLLAIAARTWPGTSFDADYIADLIADFRRLQFLDDPFQTNAMVTARAAQERAKITAATFRNLLQIKIGAVNPDRFLVRTYPRVRWFFTPAAVAVGLALFLLSLYWIYVEREHLAGGSYLALAATNGLTGFACVWLSTILVMFVHEFGHAYAVKHHGGRVDTIGFMLMFGLVAMYCDTSDSHLFPNRMHRVHVALAGTYTGFYLMPIAVGLWWLTPPGLFLHDFGYCMMVFLGVTTIVFNYNPLIKLDGYFVLADLLDMPGLQEDAFRYLGYLFQRYVLRLRIECPAVGRRRKRILVLYGVLSLAYSIFFGVVMFLVFRKLLIGAFAFLGALASIGLLVAVARRPIAPMATTARRWALDHSGMLKRRLAPILAGVALLLGIVLLLPVPASRTLPVSLEPGREAALVAPAEMRLTHAGFASGRAVGEGEALARLDAESLAVDLRASEARVRGMMVASHEARIGGDPGAAASSAGQARAESRRLQLLSREIQRADLRAPFAGTVMSFSARALEGERLEPGDTVCVVADFSTARAVARVSEFDLEDLEPGAPARVRLRSDPTHLLTGRVSAIEQSGVAGGWKSHRVWIALDHAPAGARAGLTGVAHVRLPARTPATQIIRALVRFVRLDLWV